MTEKQQKIVNILKEDFIGENEEKLNIIKWAKQKGKSLKEFFWKKREEIGTDIEKQANEDLEKFKERSFQRQELEKLKNCYETEYNDSMGSLSAILAYLSAVVAVISGIYSMIAISENQALEAGINLIFLAILVILVVIFAIRLLVISKDNEKFRNHIIAVNLALLEMESGSANPTNDENLPKDNEEAVTGEKNS